MIWLLRSKAATKAGKCHEVSRAALVVQRQLVWVETAKAVATRGNGSIESPGLDGVWSERHGVLLSGLRLHQPEGGGGGS